jgi:hypothetical protein
MGCGEEGSRVIRFPLARPSPHGSELPRRSGVSLVEIAKVLGHRTLAMVARYSHLSDGHIVATGKKLTARLGVEK